MNRRNFLASSSRFGIAATMLGGIATAKPTQQSSLQVSQPDFAEPQTKLIDISGMVVIGHPKRLRKTQLQPGVLYDGSVVKFHSDGHITLPTGRKFFGRKGDKFKLVCIRDSASKVVIKKKLFKALDWSQLRALLAAKQTAGGK